MPDFETRLKDVPHAAWLIWTANGLKGDADRLKITKPRQMAGAVSRM